MFGFLILYYYLIVKSILREGERERERKKKGNFNLPLLPLLGKIISFLFGGYWESVN